MSDFDFGSFVRALEGIPEGDSFRCRCPVHGGKSLSVARKGGRILVFCFAGCPSRDVLHALRERGLWTGRGEKLSIPTGPLGRAGTLQRLEAAERMWHEARPIRHGDPVSRYLIRRNILLGPFVPEDIRCHPALPYWTQDDNGKPVLLGKWPTMLAGVRNPQGRPVALHRTYITSDGHKAPVPSPKKILKVFDLAGGAVRLYPPREGFIAVTEGVEDALSAWVLWQIPAWAVLGTSGMKAFQPPEDVEEVLILSDNDEPGRNAALELAQRLEDMKKAVRIRVPSGPAKDINQLLTMESTR